jgi:AcrR family transcriptional regulator
MTLSYIAHLEETLERHPPRQKGQRTRERLKIATARILEQKGYHAMRVADVTEEASVAEGSFYIYFRDKTDASLTVLSDLLENFFALANRDQGERSTFEAIRAANRRWISVCRANAGLMRCVLQLGDEEAEFGRLSQRTNRVWYDLVVQGISRRRGTSSQGNTLLAVYMLGGMMDELVRRMIVYPDEGLTDLLARLKADDDAVADAASLVWLRVFYPSEPLPTKLSRPARAFARWMEAGR